MGKLVYLDTQDYIRLHNQSGPANELDAVNRIASYARCAEIAALYSVYSLAEFVTKPSEDFVGERRERGKLLKELCGHNSLPYPTDLDHRRGRYGKNLWLSSELLGRKVRDIFSGIPKAAISHFRTDTSRVNRAERRRLSSRQGFIEEMKAQGITWRNFEIDIDRTRFPSAFIERRLIQRLIWGEVNLEYVAKVFVDDLGDPERYADTTYWSAAVEDRAELLRMRGSAIAEPFLAFQEKARERKEIIARLDAAKSTLRAELRKAGYSSQQIKNEIRRYVPTDTVPPVDIGEFLKPLEKLMPQYRYAHVSHYMRKIVDDAFDVAPNDAGDLYHLIYAYDVDVFRCDSKMWSIFGDFEPFKGKLYKSAEAALEALNDA